MIILQFPEQPGGCGGFNQTNYVEPFLWNTCTCYTAQKKTYIAMHMEEVNGVFVVSESCQTLQKLFFFFAWMQFQKIFRFCPSVWHENSENPKPFHPNSFTFFGADHFFETKRVVNGGDLPAPGPCQVWFLISGSRVWRPAKGVKGGETLVLFGESQCMDF